MKTAMKLLLLCVLITLVSQCEIVSDNLLQNPNATNSENSDPDLLLNSIQITFPVFFNGIEGKPGELTRMYQMGGRTYSGAYQSQDLNGEYNAAYSILKDTKELIPKANDQKLYSHAGIARIVRAFVLVNLADYLGKVPLSQALNDSKFNPNVDGGSDIYKFAFNQLDSAIVALNKDEVLLPQNDLYFGDKNNPDKAWITLANTLKLKILYQQRLVSDNTNEINSLLNGNVIDEMGEGLIFQYSTNVNNPDSRNPDFANNYTSTGTSVGTYMSNYYMNELLHDKSVIDPRIRYYFYRQVTKTNTDPTLQGCINSSPPVHYEGNSGSGINGSDPYCEDWNDIGYWGRDHGNGDISSGNETMRSTYGVFPAGGRFDANQAEAVAKNQGLQGAGIEPIWLYFYTDFIKAEVQLAVNNDFGKAKIALENGIRNSIRYVMGFARDNNPTGTDAVTIADGAALVPPQAHTEKYVKDVLKRYDQGDKKEKMNVIAKEFYLSLFGNGIESYNLYRRIAPQKDAPNWDLQPNLNDNPGTFIRSFLYPSDLVERNSSVKQKSSWGVKVFWDNNRNDFGNF